MYVNNYHFSKMPQIHCRITNYKLKRVHTVLTSAIRNSQHIQTYCYLLLASEYLFLNTTYYRYITCREKNLFNDLIHVQFCCTTLDFWWFWVSKELSQSEQSIFYRKYSGHSLTQNVIFWKLSKFLFQGDKRKRKLWRIL